MGSSKKNLSMSWIHKAQLQSWSVDKVRRWDAQCQTYVLTHCLITRDIVRYKYNSLYWLYHLHTLRYTKLGLFCYPYGHVRFVNFQCSFHFHLEEDFVGWNSFVQLPSKPKSLGFYGCRLSPFIKLQHKFVHWNSIFQMLGRDSQMGLSLLLIFLEIYYLQQTNLLVSIYRKCTFSHS